MVKTYKSAMAFRKALESRINARAVKSGLDLQRIRRTVAFNRFLARIFADNTSPWVLKGGYAMELRLDNARATRDIDLGFRGIMNPAGEAQTDYIQRLFMKATTVDLGDFFVFNVGGVQMELDSPIYGGARYPVEALVDGRIFVTFHVDAAVGDYIPAETESVLEHDLLSFAGIKPGTFPMIPREVQFAEKLHAYTIPRAVPNSRVRDLVDMVLLLTEGKLSENKTKTAIEAVFTRRKTHPIPKALEPAPDRWIERFAELAQTCGLDMSLSAGFDVLKHFYLKLSNK